jgi:CheY-like chemotaxis protein
MTTDATPVVLVADDEPSMLALVGQHIKTMGYQVLEASDGEQAWALAQEHLPDLVILDVMMPGMSGWEVCRKIREDVALAHTAIIMLTGIGENLNELTSPLYGADSYIDKPFAFPELDEKVRGALTKRQASRPGLARTAPADGLELVRNGNGNGGHHDHPHGLLAGPETESESDPPHAEAVDEAWSSDDDEGPEVTNGADESILLVETSSITRSSRRQHAGKPPSRGNRAARGAPRKPAKAKGRAAAAKGKAKSKAKPTKRGATAKAKAKRAPAVTKGKAAKAKAGAAAVPGPRRAQRCRRRPKKGPPKSDARAPHAAKAKAKGPAKSAGRRRAGGKAFFSERTTIRAGRRWVGVACAVIVISPAWRRRGNTPSVLASLRSHGRFRKNAPRTRIS